MMGDDGDQKIVVPREKRSPRKALPPGTAFCIVGVQYRKRDALQFAAAAFRNERSGLPFGVTGVREPDNPHDPNAIRVYGGWRAKGWFGRVKTHVVHIGYVPREIADELIDVYGADGEPGLTFYSVYQKGDFLDVKVIALQP